MTCRSQWTWPVTPPLAGIFTQLHGFCPPARAGDCDLRVGARPGVRGSQPEHGGLNSRRPPVQLGRPDRGKVMWRSLAEGVGGELPPSCGYISTQKPAPRTKHCCDHYGGVIGDGLSGRLTRRSTDGYCDRYSHPPLHSHPGITPHLNFTGFWLAGIELKQPTRGGAHPRQGHFPPVGCRWRYAAILHQVLGVRSDCRSCNTLYTLVRDWMIPASVESQVLLPRCTSGNGAGGKNALLGVVRRQSSAQVTRAFNTHNTLVLSA